VFIRLIVVITALVIAAPGLALAQDGRVTAVSRAPFVRVAAAIEQAVTDQKMALVCHANAQKGAAARGVSIRGNQVFMVFRNDYAVRLLAADPAAGFEPPIRIYVYENADGTATVTYAPPSVVFGRYAHPEVQAIGRELDPIFKTIVDTGLAAR
jgi:uncharacterized protein (DUF302 family)